MEKALRRAAFAGAAGVVCLVFGSASSGEDQPPQVVKTLPACGATDVSAATTEIVVVFDQEMLPGYSWMAGPSFPEVTDDPAWRDKRTCALPVKLERGKFYRVRVNDSDGKFQNFTNARGVPAPPRVLWFVTEGASDAEKSRAIQPRLVAVSPADGEMDVDPRLARIEITFDKQMGSGMSWTGYGEKFPQGSAPAFWKDDRRTCVFPVKLKPDTEYEIGVNSVFNNNFQSADGVPAEPKVLKFKTRQDMKPEPR